MSTSVDLDSDWRAIERLFPAGWRDLATTHGVRFDPRPEFGGKITEAGVLVRLILHHVCTGSSLRVTTALAAALGVIDISPVALHKWMRKCGEWIAAMVSSMVDLGNRFGSQLWAGYEVIAVDATTVQKPGATTVTSRIHYALRLADLRAVSIQVTGIEVGESLRNFVVKHGQLWLCDRGYCNANSLAHATAGGADVLIRFCVGPMPLRVGNAAFDARTVFAKLTTSGPVMDLDVLVPAADRDAIAARLLITRLPDDKAAEAHRRLIKERGRKHVTADAIEQSRFVMLLVTVPRERLSAEQLFDLYRLRWQIELSFKRDKSIGGLDKLPNFRPDTIHTWISTHMLGAQLARKLADRGEPFPPSVIGAYALRPTVHHLFRSTTDSQ